MSVTVSAALYDPATGLRGIETYEVEDEYAESQEFLWTDGNYGCDCNRRLFLARLNGLAEPWGGDQCGDSIILESLTVGGVVVAREKA